MFGQHVHVGCAERRRRGLPDARAVALRAALHRAVRVVAVLAGRGHGLRVVAAEHGDRVPAAGPDAVRADVGRVPRLLRQDARLRHRREHEGLLLGHPAEARVRHHRDPRVRHAAHGRARGGARAPTRRRSRAGCWPSARSRPRARTTWSTATTASRPAASASRDASSTPPARGRRACATTSSMTAGRDRRGTRWARARRRRSRRSPRKAGAAMRAGCARRFESAVAARRRAPAERAVDGRDAEAARAASARG